MKLSKINEKILRTIRETVGDDEFAASDLIDRVAGARAWDNRALAAALTPRLFTVRRLAWWLRRHQGAVVDGYRLSGEFARRPSVLAYRFESLASVGGEEGAKDLDAIDAEGRIARLTKGSPYYLKELARQMDRLDERESARVESDQAPPPADIFLDDRGARHELVQLANGTSVARPLPEPAPTASVAPAAAPAAPKGEWRQPTRAELAERHQRSITGNGPVITYRGLDGVYYPDVRPREAVATLGPYSDADGGWYNPGGTVQQGIDNEQAEYSQVRVCGRWPKFRG